MAETIITKLTLQSLQELYQSAGYRVESVTDPVANLEYLRSATNGVGFDLRPGSRVAGDPHGFIDVALVAVLQVQGELPLDIVNRWNATRRFCRLQLSVPFLALSADISVAGGVTQNHLRAQLEIWDQLVQQLVAYLRDELAALSRRTEAATSNAAPTAANQPLAAPPEAAANVDAPRTVQ